MDTSTLFRLDDTVSRVEVVQGGTGAVFDPSQAGATANFTLRTGSDVPSGNVALTCASEGRKRLDGSYGFKPADGWYASVGGFFRVSDGIRSPQQQAGQGGQLLVWAHVLNDKSHFLKQVPIIQSPDGRTTPIRASIR